MPNFNQMFPSAYLKASEIPDSGAVFTIESVDQVTLKGNDGDETKWCVHFDGTEKGLILNKTNGKTLCKLFGDDTKSWIGKRCKLVSQEVEAFGERTMAIRVSIQKPSEGVQNHPKDDNIPY